MVDDLSPQVRAIYEKYKREHPKEVAEAQRKAREVVFNCISVLYSYEDSMLHVFQCKKCATALGIITIDIKLSPTK